MQVQANWTYFKEQSQNYLVASGLSEKTDAVKAATFLVILGKECYQMYQKLGVTKEQKRSVAAIIAALEEYYQPRSNITYETFVFNTCLQNPQEDCED